jgi:hypothetical protein
MVGTIYIMAFCVMTPCIYAEDGNSRFLLNIYIQKKLGKN